MMYVKVAEKYNRLLAEARPVAWDNSEYRLIAPDSAHKPIVKKVKQLIESKWDEAVHAEIQEAAEEKREAEMFSGCGVGLHDLCAGINKYYQLARRAADLALGEIEAAISAHNAQTHAAYETYRVACAQGVAVAPEEPKKE